MSEGKSENTYLVQTAAEKANNELGNEKVNKKHLLSTKAGTKILNKYEESEVNRDNSFKDPLTGLLNRRGVLEEYKLESSTRKRTGAKEEKNILVALDFIGLKKFNSEKGGEMTDRILADSGESLKGQIRSTDLAARWGGDEFLLVLFGTNEDNAKKVIDRVVENSPEGIHYNVGYQVIDNSLDAESAINNIMNRLEDIKKLGLIDDTGRSAGTGVIVNVDNI